MRSLRRGCTRLLTIATVVGTLLFITCPPTTSDASEYKSNYETIPAVNKTPPQVGRWSMTPTIIVCDYAPISETHIRSAAAFWKRLGHRIFDTQYKHDPLNICLSERPRGYIVIHLASNNMKMGETSLAETHFFVNNDTNNIEWAKIYLRSGVRTTVLEHEIGHAMGYLHHNLPGHLMHEKWPQGGWDTSGLKKY